MLSSKVLLLCAVPALVFAADIKVMEEIVAKVNGDIITRTEIDRSRQALINEMQRANAKPAQIEQALREREGDFLRDRIDQLLLTQKGKELNISVDNEISKNLADIQKEAAKNNPTLAEPEKFQQYVREQTGMPFEDYKSDMKNSLLTQRVIRQEVGGKINVPKTEVKQYYDEHKKDFMREEQVFLSEIFLSTEGKDVAGRAAAEKKAKDLLARAKKNEKFNELAASNSDSDSARQGGFLGGQKKDDLKKEIVDAIWEKSKGYITDPPLKFPNGILILRVEDHHKAGQAEFEEVEPEISERLHSKIFQPKIREYLTKLRQDAFLELKEGYADSAPATGKNTKWSDPAQLKPETVTKEEVASKTHRKRLLWAVPVPGTSTTERGKSSSKT